MSEPQGVTNLLLAWADGDDSVGDRLMPLVYAELHRIASRYLKKERSGHTLEPTALIHEAWLRLIAQRQVDWQSRAHFFAIAARMMRRILVDYARHRDRRKRRGGERVAIEIVDLADQSTPDLLALDLTLDRLAAVDRRKSSIVELHFFGGLSTAETATVMGCSASTVTREWRAAKAWIYCELRGIEGDGG